MQYRKQTTSSLPSLSVLLPHLPVLLPLFLSLLFPQPCWGLDVGRLCAIRCKLGKGGNLCHCNAFHFAGKRGHGGVVAATAAAAGGGPEEVDDNDNDDEVGEAFPLGPRSWLELALRDMEEEEEEQEAGESGNPARTLGVSGLTLSRGARLSQPGEGGDLVLGQRPEGLDRPEAVPRVRGGGRGGRAAAAGGGARGEAERLFGAAEVEEEKRGRGRGGAGERSGAVMDRLTSLIKMALDDRLIDSYEASRKRNRAVALPYEEADLVY